MDFGVDLPLSLSLSHYYAINRDKDFQILRVCLQGQEIKSNSILIGITSVDVRRVIQLLLFIP